tara:strand:- start:40735 stop:41733 length:999 start_codon:yes stop_codon:yes gene_type:complete
MRKIFLLSLVALISAFIYRYQESKKVNSQPQVSSKKISLSPKTPQSFDQKRKTIYKKEEATLAPVPKNTNHRTTRTMIPIKSKDMVNQFENGDIVVEYVEVDGDLLIAQGDLIVGDVKNLDQYQNGTKPLLLPMPRKWPNNRVPFSFSNSSSREIDMTAAASIKERVLEAVNAINDLTNVKFVEKTDNDQDYVEIQYVEGRCVSNVGYLGGKQKIGLGSGCTYVKIIHELMHTLGFFHEQNRPSSREHIQVLWENIDETNWIQFKVIPKQLISELEIPFSFETVMLYPSTSFSKFDGDFSIVKSDGSEIQMNEFPNKIDIERINKLYPKVTQ